MDLTRKSIIFAVAFIITGCSSTPQNTQDNDDDSEGENGGSGGDAPPGGMGGSDERGGKGGHAGAGGFPADAGSTSAPEVGNNDTNKHDAAASDALAGLAYDPCPPKGTACKVMPLGDSITDDLTHRMALFRRSLTANRKMTFVGNVVGAAATVEGIPLPRNHEGHSGYMVDGIAGLIPASLAANKPHIVLLMIGTNDAHRSPDVVTAPARLGKMLDNMIKILPDTLMVVAKIVPTKDTPGAAFYSPGNNERVQTFNAALGQELEARIRAGKHVIVVDMYAAFTANPNYKTLYMADHLHPNAAGYGVMADTWWAAIKDVVK